MIANHKGEIPFAILLLPFLLGIAIGVNVFPKAQLNFLWWSFFAIGIVFIFLNFTYAPLKLYKSRWLGGSLMAVILILAGWFNAVNYNELNGSQHFSKIPAQYLLIRISNEPIVKNGILRFTADVKACRNGNKNSGVTGTLLVALKDTDAIHLYYGDELVIPAKYNAIDPPFNPAEFNYKRYLANQNIYYQAFLYPADYIVPKTNTGNQLITYSLRLRQQLVAKLKCGMHDTTAIAVASTLILGYKADLSNDVLQAYSKTGTVHVLSVSGAHVAIIYILLTIALGFLDRFKYGRLVKTPVIIVLIWYYAMLSGFSPAVCRAAVMISMVIIGKTFSRYLNILNILAISAFLLLLYDPLFIADVGFQLSYLAVFGLVVFQPVVFKWFTFKNNWVGKLWALLSVSIAAQVITFPLSAFYFHQFPVYFLVSNLLIVVPTAVIMYSGLLYLLLPQVPYVSASLAYVLEKTILLMNKGLIVIEHAPYALIGKIWLSVPEYLLLYMIIFGVFYFLFSKKTWLLNVTLSGLLLFCVGISYKKITAVNQNSIVFLNLRKHQGVILKKGKEAVVLTDVKTDDKIYQYSIQPYLDSCGIALVENINFKQDFKKPWVIKRDNAVCFSNKTMVFFNAEQPIYGKIKTDYLYISGSPHIALDKINNSFEYSLLVIDAGNSNRFVSQITTEAIEKKITYKILKRNKALVLTSN